MADATVLAAFHQPNDADRAVDILRQQGLAAEHVGIAAHGDKDGMLLDTASGAVGGGIAGGLVGAAAAGLIPGIDPIVAAGIVGTTMTGALAGGTLGGMAAALREFGASEPDASFYADQFEAGSVIVAVRTDGDVRKAIKLLETEGAYRVSTGEETPT